MLGLKLTILDAKSSALQGSCPLKQDYLHLVEEGVCSDHRLGWPLGIGARRAPEVRPWRR